MPADLKSLADQLRRNDLAGFRKALASDPVHALIQEKPHGPSGEGAAGDTESGRLECLDWLIEAGADPEQLGGLQSCAASRLGRRAAAVRKKLIRITDLLLEAGADPRAKTKSWSHEVDATYFAVWADNAEILDLLLEKGGDATGALSSAIWNRGDKLADICLEHGADVNGRNHDGRPLLNEAVRWGQVRRALWLLEKGADPNQPDERGWTAVHQAVSRGNERMLRALLEAGGDPRQPDQDGRTPFDVATASALRKVGKLAGLAISRTGPCEPCRRRGSS